MYGTVFSSGTRKLKSKVSPGFSVSFTLYLLNPRLRWPRIPTPRLRRDRAGKPVKPGNNNAGLLPDNLLDVVPEHMVWIDNKSK